MGLDEALEKLFKVQNSLQEPRFTENPGLMSQAMMRMSVFATAIEEKLAEYEQDYKIKEAQTYKKTLLDEKLSATAAEKHIKIELGVEKAKITYLTRIVSAAWDEIGVLQSRINHIVKFSETTNL